MSNKVLSTSSRPAFGVSSLQRIISTPSLMEFKNLQNSVRKLEVICNRLNEEIQQLNNKHESLSSEVQRHFQFVSASKNVLPFDVQNFKIFLDNDFQQRLNIASTNYAWIHQIRYYHISIFYLATVM
jgi:hypothetical protein